MNPPYRLILLQKWPYRIYHRLRCSGFVFFLATCSLKPSKSQHNCPTLSGFSCPWCSPSPRLVSSRPGASWGRLWGTTSCTTLRTSSSLSYLSSTSHSSLVRVTRGSGVTVWVPRKKVLNFKLQLQWSWQPATGIGCWDICWTEWLGLEDKT